MMAGVSLGSVVPIEQVPKVRAVSDYYCADFYHSPRRLAQNLCDKGQLSGGEDCRTCESQCAFGRRLLQIAGRTDPAASDRYGTRRRPIYAQRGDAEPVLFAGVEIAVRETSVSIYHVRLICKGRLEQVRGWRFWLKGAA